MRLGAIENSLTGITRRRPGCPIVCPVRPVSAGPSVAPPGADEAHAPGRPDRDPRRPSPTASRLRLLPRLRARAGSLLGPLALMLAALACAAPAPAQTTVKLVSNNMQGYEFRRWSFDQDRWQPFTTGSSPTGYKLTGVDIALSQVTGNPAYTLSIETHTKGKTAFHYPGTHLATLQNPGSLVAGLNRHTVPGNASTWPPIRPTGCCWT